MIIRSARLSDANFLNELITKNAEQLLKPLYTAAQWTIFNEYYSVAIMQDKIKTQAVFCAVINGQIAGTIALNGAIVVGFYTNIECMSQGVGTLLIHHIEAYARANGLKTIELYASPIAESFYIKRGWTKIKNLNIKYLDVNFEEAYMTKKLR